ncbi:golgi matrix protein [Niveomyces insectorum RCEF 264]|uniref:Golgi matrix protein n=1 Tax=Niveomyces insectorum RCEF 264 TaxID=1081102 RepID=A0A167Z947_9HYPO|nr:golgi matrix protein [Niveomyces insectorum RCEF 264]
MASSAAPSAPQLAPQNDVAPSGGQGGAKKKNKKKKSAAAKAANAALAASAPPTGADSRDESDHDDVDTPDEPTGDATKNENDVEDAASSPTKPLETNGNGQTRNGSIANGRPIALHAQRDAAEDGDPKGDEEEEKEEDEGDTRNRKSKDRNGDPSASSADEPQQNALRAEVERLRQQVGELQNAQEAHKEETDQLRAELEESEAGREQAETQYHNLMGRVEKIKETLGERLKRDRQELDEAKDRIEELEAQNEGLRQASGAAEAAAAAAEAQVLRLQKELDDLEQEHEREHAALRGRAQLSQQNWQREKEELVRQLQQLRAELESTSGAMGEWEVIAMEERSVRETLSEKAADLEEQLAQAREQHQRAAEERDDQARAIDSLQRALQEIQEARKRELREMVESSEAQLEAAKARAQQAETASEAAVDEAAALRHELERTSPFEREVKEKNLLIGKLRHETIVLNDHLTKALRYIKKNKPEENVDRQIVTNHLLQFLTLDRSDAKRFQILQVIAGMLNWTDEQKEKAGLSRPGTSSNSLRLPASPFHRTPSTPSLNAEFFSEPTPTGGRETLADLWAGFLERSVEEAASESSNPPSRKGSLPQS